MKITKIQVENFKSFKSLDISLNTVNVIIGANASGKSNLISLFRFLDHIIIHGIEDAISLHGGIDYVLNINIGRQSPLRISFSLSFDNYQWIFSPSKKNEEELVLSGFDYSFEITPNKRGSGYKITKDSVSIICYQVNNEDEPGISLFDSQKVYTQVYRRIRHKVVSEQINSTDFDEKNIKNKMESAFVKRYLNDRKTEKELILHYLPLFIPPMFSISDFLRIYDFDPKLLKKASSLTSLRYLEEDASNLGYVLQNILKSNVLRKKLENLLSDYIPYIEKIKIQKSFDKSVTYQILEQHTAKPLYANFLSDGTVSILALIIALNFDKREGIIVIEEPERNLHPGLLQLFIEMVKEASNDHQVIITTHSPELIKHANLDDLILVNRCQDGFSCLKKPSNSAMVQTFLRDEVGVDTLFVQGLLGE